MIFDDPSTSARSGGSSVAAASSKNKRTTRREPRKHRAVIATAAFVSVSMLAVVLLETAAMTTRVALRGSQGQPSFRHPHRALLLAGEVGEEAAATGANEGVTSEALPLLSSSAEALLTPLSSTSSFELVQGRRVNYTFTDQYQCRPGTDQDIPRVALPDPIRTSPGLVDFFPQWTGRTNKNAAESFHPQPQQQHPLKVVIVGDSIAVQLSQVVDEAIGTQERVNLRNHLVGGRIKQECTHVSQSQGRGVVVAGMRLRNLLLNSTIEQRETPKSSEYWNPLVIDELLQYEIDAMSSHQQQQETHPTKEPIKNFDAMVQRIPHGWISLQDITRDSLRENAVLASQLFGIETLVLINLPLINNVVNNEGKEGYLTLLQKRQLIRNFAATWKAPPGIRLKHVLVLELGDLVDDMLEWNARLMGFDTSLPYQDWMLGHTLLVNEGAPREPKPKQRTRRRATAASRPRPSYYNHKVAHKCAVQVPETATACLRNSITYDGMHLCMSTLGGRAVSGMACLIDCSLTALEQEKGDEKLNRNNNAAHLRTCELRCNGQFMSTTPVPASMMRRLS
jgi:hypothetical protein